MMPGDLVKQLASGIVAEQRRALNEPFAKTERDETWHNEPKTGMGAAQAVPRDGRGLRCRCVRVGVPGGRTLEWRRLLWGLEFRVLSAQPLLPGRRRALRAARRGSAPRPHGLAVRGRTSRRLGGAR